MKHYENTMLHDSFLDNHAYTVALGNITSKIKRKK